MLGNLINSQNFSLCDVASPANILEESGFFNVALVVGVVAVIIVAAVLINKAVKKNSANQNKNDNQQNPKL